MCDKLINEIDHNLSFKYIVTTSDYDPCYGGCDYVQYSGTNMDDALKALNEAIKYHWDPIVKIIDIKTNKTFEIEYIDEMSWID